MSILVNNSNIITNGGKILISGGDPSTLRNLKSWFSARKETRFSNGNSVPSQIDFSGNGALRSQATSGNQATYATGVSNGQPAFNFDGTDDYYTGAVNVPKNVAGATSIIVFKKKSLTNTAYYLAYEKSGLFRIGVILNIVSTGEIQIVQMRTDGGSQAFFRAPCNDLNTHVLVSIFDFVNGVVRIWLDGFLIGQSTTPVDPGATCSNTDLTIAYTGRRTGPPASNYDGYIFEDILCDAVLTPEEFLPVVNQLKTIYGVS